MVTGWPDDLQYPADATSLWPDKSDGSIKAWHPYRILEAFYIGTKSAEGKLRLLRFQQLQWCMYSLPIYLPCMALISYQSGPVHKWPKECGHCADSGSQAAGDL